jgi:hypothetical protein
VRGRDVAWRTFPLGIGSLDLGAPLPMRNASVWLRTAAGGSPGDPDEPFANVFFGGFGNNVVDRHDPKRYREVTAFPGVELNAIAGSSFAKALVEAQLPPWRFRRAGRLAFHATWARLSLFAGGLVTNLDRAADRERWGDVGAQADMRFQLLTQQPLTLSFGYARAAPWRGRSTGEWMTSLKIL